MQGTKTATDEWLPKSEAAELAGISPRQLERREAQGYVEKRVEPRGPMQRTAPVLYSRADILALKAGTPNIHAREVTNSKPILSPSKTGEIGKELAKNGRDPGSVISTALALAVPKGGEAFQHFLAALLHANPIRREQPWIPLAEAVEYSGLSAAFLLRKAKGGVPWAVDVGRGRKAFWRFNRAALTQGSL